jgi:FixJ family two-component response regulator
MEVTSFLDAVLVVDDEPLVLEVAATAISMRGLEVVTAGTADEALALLRQRGFGCLLTDKNLPGMNGIELIRETLRLQPHCACMVMTGYASTQSAVEALRLGAVDYLTKPFESLPLVAEKVWRAIENNRAQHERMRLLQRLSDFQAELSQRADQVSRQRTEIEMFNEILELRVAQATSDLRRERDELLARMGGGASRAEAEIVGAEMALILVRDIQLADAPEVAPLRGELQRVVRQLERHIESLRKAGLPG